MGGDARKPPVAVQPNSGFSRPSFFMRLYSRVPAQGTSGVTTAMVGSKATNASISWEMFSGVWKSKPRMSEPAV